MNALGLAGDRIFKEKPHSTHRLAGRALAALRWFVPAALLAILPKCPACLAAYVAMGTGIGLSLPVATHVRTLLIVVCVTSLLYFATRRFSRFIPRLRNRRG